MKKIKTWLVGKSLLAENKINMLAGKVNRPSVFIWVIFIMVVAALVVGFNFGTTCQMEADYEVIRMPQIVSRHNSATEQPIKIVRLANGQEIVWAYVK